MLVKEASRKNLNMNELNMAPPANPSMMYLWVPSGSMIIMTMSEMETEENKINETHKQNLLKFISMNFNKYEQINLFLLKKKNKYKMRFFTIFGERCSGTIFTEFAIKDNFDIQYIRNEKHFFGHDNDFKDINDPGSTLFIFVVRHPIDWIDSFYKRHHHVPLHLLNSVHDFITQEWYSVYEEGPNKDEEIMEDRNMHTKERYKNLFELRYTKTRYVLDYISHKVKHFYLLRYEDLRDHYEETLEKLEKLFELKRRNSDFKKIIKYKGTYNQLYQKKPILLTDNEKEYIKNHVNKDQEQKLLGYINC